MNTLRTSTEDLVARTSGKLRSSFRRKILFQVATVILGAIFLMVVNFPEGHPWLTATFLLLAVLLAGLRPAWVAVKQWRDLRTLDAIQYLVADERPEALLKLARRRGPLDWTARKVVAEIESFTRS